MIAGLIVAAGRGVRMGGGERKQYRILAGRPVLVHSLAAFDACREIDRLIVVIPESEFDFCQRNILKSANLRKPISLVAGGARRQDSVYNGLKAIDADQGIVLIHDGVRPLVTSDLIDKCISGARKWRACIPALAVSDTLKQVDAQGVICGTPLRDTIYLAQTPQAFDLVWIREAHEAARRHDWQATDDASLIEQLGRPVHIFSGSKHNLKLTTAEDLILAEALLAVHRQV
jgi:2-C-methyl-D-erythritol 4-phosphate cytidylyltransferase